MTRAISPAAVQRELGRRSLRDFTRYAWHLVEPTNEFKDNWHIGAISEHLEAVTRGQIKRLVINIPPGCMKSLTTSVFWPCWTWLQDPGFCFLFASFDATLTQRDAKRMLGILQSPWFKERWPEVILRKKDPPVGEFENTAAGFRFSTSVKGKATGRHADALVVDDPIKPSDMGKIALQGVQTWWKETMASRLKDPDASAKVVMMQRVHDDDLSGALIREGGYEHLCLPMRYEPGRKCVTSLGSVDPRTEEGELLWPNRFTPAAVVDLEREMGSRVSAAQLQQRPNPEGGSVFKRAWFGTWVRPEEQPPKTGRWKGLPEKFDQLVQSWDCTFKESATSDYVVGQVWGRKGPDYFCVAQVRARLDFPGTLDAIRALSRQWSKAITKLVEDKANGSAVISTLKKELSGLIPVNPEGGKEARANSVAPLYEAGNVYYPDPARVAWVDEHFNEMVSFPVGSHDDTVDAASQALLWMHQKKTPFSAAMEQFRKNGYRLP